MEIKIKKLYKDAVTPTRGSEEAAGYDLYACLGGFEECEISPNTTMKIGTGIAAEIPNGYFGAVFARSGLATKRGLRPANCVGVIDSDYRGEIIVALHNDTDSPQKIQAYERIAQLIILPYLNVSFKEVDELSDTERGEGGFGSTGTTGGIKMNKNADKFAFIATVVFIFIIAIIGCITVFWKYPATDITPSGIKWDGNSITVNRDKSEKYIAIPCFTDVNFIANQTAQKVNIYNPEENECVMSFTIMLSDGTVIWESDNVYPGYGFHDIEITQTLSAGTYEARLITRCFTMDKNSELNGSSFKFKINVIGD